MGDVYALDFDGVICDNCCESSRSAVKAAKLRWLSLFEGVDSAMEDWIVDQMHTVRHVVETGYENLLLVRLLLEMRIPSIHKSSAAEGLTIDGILEKWSDIKHVSMKAWEENIDDLIDLFGKTLSRHFGCSKICKLKDIYVVTTKQGRFADALLRELAGVAIPPERLYGLGTGSKVEVLKQLQAKPENQGMNLHFVEDCLATLKNVIKEPELDGWNLYLVIRGYNTEKEQAEVASIPRIRLLELSDFSKKLK